MLVLSRKKSEEILINDDISVIVVAINGDKVRLGVKAPKTYSVHRKEVYEEIQANGSTERIPSRPHAEISHNEMSAEDALMLLSYRDYQFSGMERVALENLIRRLAGKDAA